MEREIGDAASHSGATGREELTHFDAIDSVITDPDAWDDSALISAFDAAVRDYNRPARSKGKARVVESSFEGHIKNTDAPATKSTIPVIEAALTTTTRDNEQCAQTQPTRGSNIDSVLSSLQSSDPRDKEQSSMMDDLRPTSLPTLIPPPPPPVLPGAQTDHELEDLLMAWYEAGYRAGLYVGRRRS